MMVETRCRKKGELPTGGENTEKKVVGQSFSTLVNALAWRRLEKLSLRGAALKESLPPLPGHRSAAPKNYNPGAL